MDARVELFLSSIEYLALSSRVATDIALKTTNDSFRPPVTTAIAYLASLQDRRHSLSGQRLHEAHQNHDMLHDFYYFYSSHDREHRLHTTPHLAQALGIGRGFSEPRFVCQMRLLLEHILVVKLAGLALPLCTIWRVKCGSRRPR